MENERIFDFAKMNVGEFEKIRKEEGWGLTLEEFREAQKRAGKPLNITESYILDSLWSDHCSYKNSKYKLSQLLRNNRYVLKTEGSDAGAVKIGDSGYCAVFKIESHNHPTLLNPFDGAATGAGGIMRDIFSMGAINLGIGVSLRYGPKKSKQSKNVLTGAMDGASFYCKAMEVPLIALDVYYDDSFKDNCLMNVAAIGVTKKDGLIPNIAPKNSVGYNLIYIGKPTAGAAVGGASFASQAFEEGKTKEIEFGSNPFLEKATFDAFERVKEALRDKKLLSQISLKDMGAAGLTCSTAEQVSERGYGIEILTDKVPVLKGKKIHPLALAVGEDQERNMLIASDKATQVILDIFKNDKNFKKHGGKVAIIGKVLKEDRFLMRDSKRIYCDIPVSLITGAPIYKPTLKRPPSRRLSFNIPQPKSIKEEIVKVISSKNVYSKDDIFCMLKDKRYGYLATTPDKTDISVIAPLKDVKTAEKHRYTGVSLVFGGKSIHGRDGEAEAQAYLATVIARLKLASAGLKPIAAADGCNYGNPNNPEDYFSFSKGIDGLNKACAIPLYGEEKEILAIVSGNVSFSNTHINKGKEVSIDPSLIPVVFGFIKDYRKTVTAGLKGNDNLLFLAGKRTKELKGSEYALLHKRFGGAVPSISSVEAGNLEYAALAAAEKGILLASAAIENGGLAATLVRMIMSADKKQLGIEIDMDALGELREDYALFSESPGYVMEIATGNAATIKNIFNKYNIHLIPLGTTTMNGEFKGTSKRGTVFKISNSEILKNWGRK